MRAWDRERGRAPRAPHYNIVVIVWADRLPYAICAARDCQRRLPGQRAEIDRPRCGVHRHRGVPTVAWCEGCRFSVPCVGVRSIGYCEVLVSCGCFICRSVQCFATQVTRSAVGLRVRLGLRRSQRCSANRVASHISVLIIGCVDFVALHWLFFRDPAFLCTRAVALLATKHGRVQAGSRKLSANLSAENQTLRPFHSAVTRLGLV